MELNTQQGLKPYRHIYECVSSTVDNKINANTGKLLTTKRGNVLEIISLESPEPAINASIETSEAFSLNKPNNGNNGPMCDDHKPCIRYDLVHSKTLDLKLSMIIGSGFYHLEWCMKYDHWGFIIRGGNITRSRFNLRPTVCNKNNLISTKKDDYKPCNITIGTCNIQSIKLKELQLSELIRDFATGCYRDMAYK